MTAPKVPKVVALECTACYNPHPVPDRLFHDPPSEKHPLLRLDDVVAWLEHRSNTLEDPWCAKTLANELREVK